MKLSKDLIKKIVELWKIENKSEVKHEDVEGLGKLLFKLNYEITPISTTLSKVALEQKALPGLIDFLKAFISQVKYPPKIMPSFPFEELAARLIKVYGVKGAE